MANKPALSLSWEVGECMCNNKGFILSEALLLFLIVSLLLLLSGQCVLLYQHLQRMNPMDEEVVEAYEADITW